MERNFDLSNPFLLAREIIEYNISILYCIVWQWCSDERLQSLSPRGLTWLMDEGHVMFPRGLAWDQNAEILMRL